MGLGRSPWSPWLMRDVWLCHSSKQSMNSLLPCFLARTSRASVTLRSGRKQLSLFQKNAARKRTWRFWTTKQGSIFDESSLQLMEARWELLLTIPYWRKMKLATWWLIQDASEEIQIPKYASWWLVKSISSSMIEKKTAPQCLRQM